MRLEAWGLREEPVYADFLFDRAACTSSQIRVGVSGSSRGCTPSALSAFATALAITPPAPGRPLPFPEGERPELPEETLRRDALALRTLV